MSEANQHSGLAAVIASSLQDIVECVENDCQSCHDDARVALDNLRGLEEQLEALRAAVQKELDYMDGFPDVEDGSPLALVIESLRLALWNPASGEPGATDGPSATAPSNPATEAIDTPTNLAQSLPPLPYPAKRPT